MKMKRRDFFSAGAVSLTGLALAGSPLARAQGQPFKPVEGRDYRVLQDPVRQDAPPKKIEVIEFFWYACPHCYKLEPSLERWTTTLPADVVFHRVPMFLRPSSLAHQKLFYALQMMGLIGALHRKVFDAFFNGTFNGELDTPLDTIANFLAKNGVDRQKFLDTFNSFTVQQVKVREANRLAEAYGVNSTPTLAIGGRYVTLPAENPEQLLHTVDYLIGLARKKA
jgi:thiol:disulfide interchange protein DsbA